MKFPLFSDYVISRTKFPNGNIQPTSQWIFIANFCRAHWRCEMSILVIIFPEYKANHELNIIMSEIMEPLLYRLVTFQKLAIFLMMYNVKWFISIVYMLSQRL